MNSTSEARDELYGRPTAAELLAAVAEFLDNEVRTALGPEHAQTAFHARVAANVLRIVGRPMLDETAAAALVPLAELGFSSEREFAAAIRAGELDDRPEEVLNCLREIVRCRLDVAHPGYRES
ncbi:MAG: DUF6285 domain-containing protein [Mycolicibacterium hassiacum]|nr:MAG: hypothetical protein DIU75_01315 [Mycolicibacterium hassiacum]